MKNILLLLLLSFTVEAQVVYLEGEVPILITVPHNGTYNTPFIEDNPNKLADLYTRSIANAIYELSEVKPHILIFDLHRKDVDVNRPSDGTFYYEMYHYAIQKLLPEINLLIDLHGHTHKHELIEFGYDVSKQDINNRTYSPNLKYKQFHLSQEDILFNYSLGNYLSYLSYPSSKIQTLNGSYFNGGYTVEQYGSDDVLAIQIELPKELRFNKNLRDEFSQEMAKHLLTYYEKIKWNKK